MTTKSGKNCPTTRLNPNYLAHRASSLLLFCLAKRYTKLEFYFVGCLMSEKVTINDVAQLAGVLPSTVFNLLNGRSQQPTSVSTKLEEHQGETMTAYIVMGVSGCGKTTVGMALAKKLDCPFYDGDDFHPPENVAKMASGVPLDDDDRAPWLARLHDLLAGHVERGETAVLACSALKKKYREQLQVNKQTCFIFLQGSFELIWERMQARQNHYMKAEMLQSQFDALEPPSADEAITIAIDQEIKLILSHIEQRTKS